MQVYTENSADVCTTLLWRLTSQGHNSDDMFRLVSDVIGVVRMGGLFTLQNINESLRLRGWPEDVLDTFTLELILSLLESEFGCEVNSHAVH